MKRLTLFCIVFFFFTHLVIAQISTFQNNYNTTDYNISDNGEDIVATKDRFLLKSTLPCTDSSGAIVLCTGMIMIDSVGNVVWKNIYDAYPFALGILDIKLLPAGDFASCGAIGTNEGFRPYVFRMTSSGDTLWSKTYQDAAKKKATKIIANKDGGFLIQGYGSTGQYLQHVWIMKTDSLGIKQWDKIIEIGSPQYIGEDFAVLPNGDLAFGYRNSPVQDYQETLALTRTDSLGNVLWTKEYQTNEDDYCNAYMTPLLNGGFVLGYCIDTSGFNMQYNRPPKLFATDSLGNLVWTYTFTGKYRRTITKLITASNGDIIGSGFRILDDGMYGWLFRLTQQGQLLWKRAYRPEQAWPGNILSELNDVTETPDGGIAAIGSMLDTLPNGTINLDVWLLKVDADGCLTPGCTDSIVTATVERQGGVLYTGRQVFFRLWPNPVSGEAQVAFYQPAPQGARLRVFNAQGMPVAQQDVPPGSTAAQVDFSGLPPGLYLVQYLRQGRVLQVEKVVRE